MREILCPDFNQSSAYYPKLQLIINVLATAVLLSMIITNVAVDTKSHVTIILLTAVSGSIEFLIMTSFGINVGKWRAQNTLCIGEPNTPWDLSNYIMFFLSSAAKPASFLMVILCVFHLFNMVYVLPIISLILVNVLVALMLAVAVMDYIVQPTDYLFEPLSESL
jgi:hypothetical protein